MARGTIYDEHLVVEFSRRYNTASGKKEKGDAVRWFQEHTGVSYSTARNVLQKIGAGRGCHEVAAGRQKRRSRKTEFQQAQEFQHAKIIAAIKTLPGADKSKWIPTEHALRIAENMGLIPPGMYTRSRMDALLRKYHLNKASTKKRRTAWKLTAKHSMQVLVVDATPMDQYYIRIDGRINRYDLPEGDKHLDDFLARERLAKIWVYYGMELYSGAFLAMPYASLPKGEHSKNSGENADDWFDYLKFFCLSKKGLPQILNEYPHPLSNCPLEGLPAIIYCDRGSGIGNSSLINSTFGNLGVRVITHIPKNPSAKGMIEGRISAFKRSFECQILPEKISNINQLIHFYLAWANHYNESRGRYNLFAEGIPQGGLVKLTDKNFRDANIARMEKTINAYGCVSINKVQYFVTWDEKWRGEKITVFRHPLQEEGVPFTAKLGDQVVWLKEGVPNHDFEEIKSHPISEGMINREEVKAVSKSVRGMMTYEDTLPPAEETNVVRFPIQAREISTHSPAAPPTFQTAEEALRWILNQTALFYEQIPPASRQALDTTLAACMENPGYVPGEVAVTIANLINQHKQNNSEEVSNE